MYVIEYALNYMSNEELFAYSYAIRSKDMLIFFLERGLVPNEKLLLELIEYVDKDTIQYLISDIGCSYDVNNLKNYYNAAHKSKRLEENFACI